jgi:hypothetical protein
MIADADRTIQGYQDRVFWERNTLNMMNGSKNGSNMGALLLPFNE